MSICRLSDFCQLSDVGQRRKHNEDSSAVLPDLGLAMVADGMGGYKAGEVASAIAVHRVLEQIRAFAEETRPGGVDDESGYTRASIAIRNAIVHANEEIFDKANGIPQCAGMGTTAVVALFYDDAVSLAHVGDSRAYRLRDDTLELVTHDHSLAQRFADQNGEGGTARPAPKNLVTRALGVERTVRIEITQTQLIAGDIFMLCSDGLSDMVPDDEIGLTLGKYAANLRQAAEALVAKANQNGGRDNISVVLLRPQPATGNRGRGFVPRLGKRRA